MSLFCRGFQFFKYDIILELKANFTVRRHILVFYFFLILTGVMRKEKGRKRGKKKMDERQQERENESGDVEERIEEGRKRVQRRVHKRLRSDWNLLRKLARKRRGVRRNSESHSAAKRARVCATFTDSQETAIVEFVKEHPELYNKEHARFHDRQKKEALWAEISAELKLQPFDVRRWFES